MDTYQFQIDDILNNGMIPAIRKRDIIIVRMIPYKECKEIEPGEPNVIAKTPSGSQFMLHRSDLTYGYKHINGEKLKLRWMDKGKSYTVYREDNSSAFVMMVPSNCTVCINGVYANKSGRKNADYIVALADESGGIDRNTIGIISSAMFKKMYYIPSNDIITRNKGKGHKLFGQGPGGLDERGGKCTWKSRKTRQNKKGVLNFAEDLGMDTESFDFGDKDIQTTPDVKVNAQNQVKQIPSSHISSKVQNKWGSPVVRNTTQQPLQSQQTKQYIAVGRLLNQSGQLVGFVIQAQNNTTRNLNIKQTMELCNRKLVRNLMLTRQSDGKIYLRGNNIRIDSLPAYNI